jgi:2-octaprenyl-6-methoxyphenol hydroxylase
MDGSAERFDVIIGGGGGAALTLAVALSQALGPLIRIAVITGAAFDEATAGPRPPEMRALALAAGSRRMLAALNIWDALADDAQAITAIDITDSSLEAGIRPILLSYDNCIEGGEPAAWVVENAKLTQGLRGAAQRAPSVALIDRARIIAFETDLHGVTTQLVDGRSLRAALLVAADGRRSHLREMADIKTVGWRYPQIGIITTVFHERPHNGRAIQHFLPAGPFAILPLTGNRSCITWTEDAEEGNRILALDNAGFLAEASKRFGYRLGEITLASSPLAWPLELQIARSLIAARFVLVGEAAHTVHPLAGQGLNLALRDVAALTEVLADTARLGLDFGSAVGLERYQRWRRADSALSAGTFDALNRLFSNDVTLLRTMRGAGLAIVDRLPDLKRIIVAEAAGLTGSVPRLLRGEMA